MQGKSPRGTPGDDGSDRLPSSKLHHGMHPSPESNSQNTKNYYFCLFNLPCSVLGLTYIYRQTHMNIVVPGAMPT